MIWHYKYYFISAIPGKDKGRIRLNFVSFGIRSFGYFAPKVGRILTADFVDYFYADKKRRCGKVQTVISTELHFWQRYLHFTLWTVYFLLKRFCLVCKPVKWVILSSYYV